MITLMFVMVTLVLVIISVLGTVFFIVTGVIDLENRGFINIQLNNPITDEKDISGDE